MVGPQTTRHEILFLSRNEEPKQKLAQESKTPYKHFTTTSSLKETQTQVSTFFHKLYYLVYISIISNIFPYYICLRKHLSGKVDIVFMMQLGE